MSAFNFSPQTSMALTPQVVQGTEKLASGIANAIVPSARAADVPSVGVPAMLARPPSAEDYVRQAPPVAPVVPQPGGMGGVPQFGAVQGIQNLLSREASRARQGAANLQGLTQEQIDAAMSRQAVEQYQAEDMLSAARAKESAATTFAAEQAARQKTVTDAVEGQRSKIAAADADVAKMTVDPGRLLGSSRNQVIAGIASAFGAFAQVMGGSQTNLALSAIDKAIAADVEGQREQLASKQRGAAAMRTQLGEMRQRFGDEEDAAKALMLAKYQAAEAQATTIAAKYQSPKIAAANQELIAGLKMKQEQIKNELLSSAANLSLEGLSVQADAEAAGLRAMGEVAKAGKALTVPGLAGKATSDKAHADATNVMGGYLELKNGTDALRKIAEMPGASTDLNQRDKADLILQSMVSAIGAMSNAGTPGELELERFQAMLPKDPTSLLTRDSRQLASLVNFMDVIKNRTSGFLQARGLAFPGAPSTFKAE